MRSRNIKPGFFKDGRLLICDPLSRLLFAGLWCCADREGRFKWRTLELKVEVLPYDNCDIEFLLDQLLKENLIIKYSVDEKEYGYIPNFHKHQKPHHMEKPSEIPPPTNIGNKFNHEPLTKCKRLEAYEKCGRKCADCGSKQNLQIDHIIPISLGGTSDIDNLQILCRSCNLKKSNKIMLSQRTVRQRFVNGSSMEERRTGDEPLIPDSLIPDSLIHKEDESDDRPFVSSKKKDEAFSLPNLKNPDDGKIKDYIKTACQILYEQRDFKKVKTLCNTLRKKKINDKTIAHILKRCVDSKKSGDLWGYCLHIAEIEDGNINESDFLAGEKRKNKKRPDSLKEIFKGAQK